VTGARVRVAHTSQLGAATTAAARALLADVFPDLEESDWEHSLGGMHALLWDGGELAGHAAVVQRRLLHGGRALRTGYVEGVAVRADRRRRGDGAALMAALRDVIGAAYDLGALAATDDALEFYAALGWQVWRGPTSGLTPAGVVRTPDEDGAVFVLPVPGGPPLDLDGELTADWRDGDVW
jgi:aminoglycoside 2'-N-acetyltransferase I